MLAFNEVMQWHRQRSWQDTVFNNPHGTGDDNMNYKHFSKDILILSFIIILFSCATTGSGSGISLQEAIEQSAEKIAGDLPSESIVAVVAFESENNNLSDYIIGELNGALVASGVTVVTRRSLEYVQKELNFQLSGEVSDETAQSIGKFFGAELVIVGGLRFLGGTYRYSIDAINVEEARHRSSVRLGVQNDRATQRMIRTLGNQQAPDRTIITEQTIPTTPLDFLELGILLAMRSEYELAIMNFTDAITLNPNLIGAYMLRGRALYASVSVVFHVEENFEDVITVNEGREVSIERQEIYDLAIEDYSQAIRLSPNFSTAYLERAAIYNSKGDYDRAIADSNQAIRLSPNTAFAYNERGDAYLNKGDYDRAIMDYSQAIRLDPNSSIAYAQRGFGYYSKGDYDHAITDYSQAISLNPNFSVAYNVRGNVYLTKGDYNRAITDYSQAIRLDPNTAFAYNGRGNAYLNKGDYDRAIADYSQAISLDPNTEFAYNGRGNAYLAKGDYDRAIADYEAALRLDPNDQIIKENLEAAQWARGR
jgi:tetratricopeptide (TPR) repeat protein